MTNIYKVGGSVHKAISDFGGWSLSADECPDTIFDSLDITRSTKNDYLARIPLFLTFTYSHGLSRDLLLDYKKYLRSRTDLSVSSKNKYLVVARMALRELYRRGKIPVDMSVGIKSFQQSTQHKIFGLTDSEVVKISRYLQEADDSFSNVRLRALMALLLMQGLRQIEICRLDVSDIDIPNWSIQVLGKGKDDKEYINTHPETTKALTAYLKRSQVKSGPLFTSLLGQKTGRRLSTRGLRQIVQDLFHILNIDRVAHGTRHYFTTKLIRTYKSDLATVAKFTRHKNLEMLNVYNDQVITASSLDGYYATFKTKLS